MILLLGVAGSGKSTQGALLSATGLFRWFSVGAVLRKYANTDEQARMLTGAILPDDVTISYVEREIIALGNEPELVIDGFPRSAAQADWLIRFSEQYDPLRLVVHLTADRDAVKRRLLARGRSDDTEQAIAQRFKEYDTAILPIIADCQAADIPVIEVDALQSVHEVHDQIVSIITKDS